MRKRRIQRNDCIADRKSRKSPGELSEVIDDFDVVLAAPQMKCNEEMIRETCEEHGKKYAIIDNYAFATLDGTKCFELAKNLI